MKQQIVSALAVAALAGCSPAADISKIYVLSMDNTVKATLYTPEGQRVGPAFQRPWLSTPTGIAVDSFGRILVSHMDAGPNHIDAYDDGKPVAGAIKLSTGGIGLAEMGGRIYVGTQERNGNATIRSFEADGQPGPKVMTDVKDMSAVAADKEGRVYVTSCINSIMKTYSEGQPSKPTIGGLQTPRGIAIGREGKIHIATFTGVRSFLPDGKETGPGIRHPNNDGGVDTAMAVTVDASGRIYVGYNSGVIGIHASDGKKIKEFQGPRGIQAIAVR